MRRGFIRFPLGRRPITQTAVQMQRGIEGHQNKTEEDSKFGKSERQLQPGGGLPLTDGERKNIATEIRSVTWPKLEERLGKDILEKIVADL